MRPVLYTLTLLLALAPSSVKAGASAAHLYPDCPTITVECVDCPEGGVWTGIPVTFTARIGGATPNLQPTLNQLTFNWTISLGRITEGQGTNSINVDTSDLYFKPITATVEVGGLGGSCPKTASTTLQVINCGLGLGGKFDEYGDIDFRDEQARLDNFAVQLENEASAVGYIMIYAGRRARINEAQRRLDRAKNYLVNVHGISPSRIVTIDAGYRVELTVELWVARPGSAPLEPDKATTIDPSEVEIIPDPPQTERARKRNR